LLSEACQVKIKELAAAFDCGALTDAQNIQVSLSSSVDWKDHRDWIKGIAHLISVAQKDAAASASSSQPGGYPMPSAAAPRGPPPPTYNNYPAPPSGGPRMMMGGGGPPVYGGMANPPPSYGYQQG